MRKKQTLFLSFGRSVKEASSLHSLTLLVKFEIAVTLKGHSHAKFVDQNWIKI